MRWILIFVALVAPFFAKEASPQKISLSVDEGVSIHFPEEFDTDKLQINFMITGYFGGYGSFVRVEPNVRNYQFPIASEDGKTAETLKLIVFSPKYRTMVFDFPTLKNQKRRIEIEPERSKTVSFAGKVLLSNLPDAKQFRLQANYTANWQCKFYGLNDCLLAPFPIASADLNADGSFHIELPDFANDKTIAAFDEIGEFSFDLRHKENGRLRSSLKLQANPKGFGSIQAAASYPNENVFILETER